VSRLKSLKPNQLNSNSNIGLRWLQSHQLTSIKENMKIIAKYEIHTPTSTNSPPM